MNQILTTGNKDGKKNNSPMDIKKVIIIFVILLVIFGAILIVLGTGVLDKNKKKEETTKQPGVPVVETPATIAPTGDEQLPEISLSVSGENVRIVARDETEMDYIQYCWNDEEMQTVKRDPADVNKIQVSVPLSQGKNTLKVIAVDKAGNKEEKTQEFKGEIRPTIELKRDETGKKVIIFAKCDDGISKLEFTVNGNWTRIPFEDYSNFSQSDWAQVGVDLEYSEDGKIISVKYSVPLKSGENVVNVYAYSVEGLVGERTGKATVAEENQ